jgi:hypothetical protein
MLCGWPRRSAAQAGPPEGRLAETRLAEARLAEARLAETRLAEARLAEAFQVLQSGWQVLVG